jgi:predicted RNase H-like nuclease (RuvC/YqgF family)
MESMSSSSMKKIVIAFTLLVVIAFGGWFAWDHHQSSEEVAKALNQVKMTSALISQQYSLEKNGSGITFGEYFNKASAAADTIDKGILELRTGDWHRRADAKDAAIEFMTSTSDLIRLASINMRTQMQLNSAEERAEEAKRERETTTNEYSRKSAADREAKATDEQIELLQKTLENIKHNREKAEALLASDNKIKALFGSSEGVAPELLAKIKPKKT